MAVSQPLSDEQLTCHTCEQLVTDSQRVCGSEVDCCPPPPPPTHTSAGYLNVEEGHALLGLGVVTGHSVHRLRDEVQDEVEVELVLYLSGRGRGNVVNNR